MARKRNSPGWSPLDVVAVIAAAGLVAIPIAALFARRPQIVIVVRYPGEDPTPDPGDLQDDPQEDHQPLHIVGGVQKAS